METELVLKIFDKMQVLEQKMEEMTNTHSTIIESQNRMENALQHIQNCVSPISSSHSAFNCRKYGTVNPAHKSSYEPQVYQNKFFANVVWIFAITAPISPFLLRFF